MLYRYTKSSSDLDHIHTQVATAQRGMNNKNILYCRWDSSFDHCPLCERYEICPNQNPCLKVFFNNTLSTEDETILNSIANES